ncbi:MAG: hypothetical protein ABW185_05625 [Sedimenticola sp.]
MSGQRSKAIPAMTSSDQDPIDYSFGFPGALSLVTLSDSGSGVKQDRL